MLWIETALSSDNGVWLQRLLSVIKMQITNKEVTLNRCTTGIKISIVQFQRKSIPAPWKIIGNSKGEGVLKVKILKAKYEAKLEFPGGIGGGLKTKTFCGRSTDIFWNCTFQPTTRSLET